MSTVIPYLIERELLSGRSVQLAGVGSLSLERGSALLSQDMSMLVPPTETLFLHPLREDLAQFVSVLSVYLKESSSVGSYFDQDEFLQKAEDMYAEWYSSSVRVLESGASVLTVESVCDISLDMPCSVVGIYPSFLSLICSDQEPMYVGAPVYSQPSVSAAQPPFAHGQQQSQQAAQPGQQPGHPQQPHQSQYQQPHAQQYSQPHQGGYAQQGAQYDAQYGAQYGAQNGAQNGAQYSAPNGGGYGQPQAEMYGDYRDAQQRGGGDVRGVRPRSNRQSMRLQQLPVARVSSVAVGFAVSCFVLSVGYVAYCLLG